MSTSSLSPPVDAAAAYARLVSSRYSCRAFLPQPLAKAQIEQMLALAQRAPSDCNTQAWHTFVLSGAPLEALRTRLLHAVQSGAAHSPDLAPIAKYEGELLARRRECGWALYEAIGIRKGDRAASQAQAMKNFRLFDAPHFAVIAFDSSLGERGVFDAGIYMGYLLLAAKALGIDAVPQAAPTHFAGLLREAAQVPTHLRIACTLSFGISDANDPANGFRTSRAVAEDYATFID